MKSSTTRRALFAVVFASAVVMYALPYRQANCNTSSHYALVQMLASGERSIDRIHGQSCDISWSGGHFYSNKAPGLALVTTPWYLLLRSAGAIERVPDAQAPWPRAMRSIPRRDLWLMGLWGALLPALGSLLLVRRLAERIEPGSGVVTAAALGFATMLLPFASLFFSHALAALTGLAAFALVVERRSPALAGVVAGLGVVVEYPLALLAVALGLSFVLRRDSAAAAWFAAGAAAGVAPLLVFNIWCFGSPLHLSYIGAVLVPGVTGHDVLGANSSGFFGIGWPHARAAYDVLIGRRGLLSVTPVLAVVPVGVALIWRAGRRLEAGLIGGVCALFLLYNFGYYSPLGGATPGPRLLVCVLGIAVVALAPLVRVIPFTLCALVVGSAGSMLAADLTQPLISPPFDTGDWWEWLGGSHLTSTIVMPGSHSWLGAAPIAIAAAAGVAAAYLSPAPAGRADAHAAVVNLLVWVAVLEVAPTELKTYAAAAGAVTAGAALALASHRGAVLADRVGVVGGRVRALPILVRILWAVAALLCLDIALRMW